MEEGGNRRDQANAKWAMENEKCKVTERCRAVGSPFFTKGAKNAKLPERRNEAAKRLGLIKVNQSKIGALFWEEEVNGADEGP
jgi:hypothetical protein